MINPKALDAAFGRTLAEIAAILGVGDVIAIDRKALRGARDKGQNAGQSARTRMMVSAYATRRLAVEAWPAIGSRTKARCRSALAGSRWCSGCGAARRTGCPSPLFLSDQWRSNGSIGENRVDLVGHYLEHVLEELAGSLSVSCCNELSNGELECPVDADEQTELPFTGLHFRDVDVEEPDRIALELLPLGFVSLDIRQTRNSMSLQASMQR